MTTKATTKNRTVKANAKADIKADRKRTAADEKKTAATTFSLADLAREMGVNPKIARAKARRNAADFTKLRVRGDYGWVFPMKAKADVSRLLKGA